ncbi:MAG: hypothetical protein LBI79_08000 [Nitrososphaerota archaeon]|nr:hypothetical protein [Nitrososphaerota archaeon]
MSKRVFLVFIVMGVCFVLFVGVALNFGLRGDFNGKEKSISVKDFPLEVDLCNTVFNAGEKISFTATITNKCGKDVNVSSNGFMPCMYFHEINDTDYIHVETTELHEEVLRANDKMSRAFNFTMTKPPGTYVFYVHYRMDVEGVGTIRDGVELIVEVK